MHNGNILFHQDIIIITANAAGEKYLIKAKSIQDILDDWNGDCEFVPSNDACVFYTEWNGRPINPAGYTDFGTLIEYLKRFAENEEAAFKKEKPIINFPRRA